jgi:hypothetical protein
LRPRESEVQPTPTAGRLFNSVAAGFLESREADGIGPKKHLIQSASGSQETEEETLRIMRGTTMAWENAVLSENEDDIEKARQRSVFYG